MIYRNFDVCNVENFWEKWGHDLKFHIGKNSCANCSFAMLLVPFMHQKSYVFACFTVDKGNWLKILAFARYINESGELVKNFEKITEDKK